MKQVQRREGPHGPELVFSPDFNIAAELIDRHIAEGRAQLPAIYSLEETVTYQALQDNANRYANALLKLGLAPGDRALMIVKDAPEFFYLFWGAVKAGIIAVPLNTMLTAEDYKFIISDSGAKALFYSEDFADRVTAATAEGAPKNLMLARGGAASLHDLASRESPVFETRKASSEAECFWLYSSGTTGRPKGVIHVHRDIAATCQFYAVETLGAKEGDIFYSIPRLFFAYGLGCAMTFPLWVGGAVILDPRRPMPEIAVELIQKFKPTIFAAVPTFLSALMAASVVTAEDLKCLRRCVSGGEALPEELQKRWLQVASVPVTDGIGSTEALHIYISNSINDVRPNASGRVVPGYQARIIDEKGDEIRDDSPGRLWIKGPSVTQRYWNNPEKTAASIVDGWLDTGDTYRRDADGYYYYCGRNDDMLKVGGIWVSPFEVEGALMGHPDILEAAVVGRTDDSQLVKPEAWIVLKNPNRASDKLAEDIRNHCRTVLAPYKYPRWIHFVEVLPKTATGKIQRFKLRQN
jgi:benzoate-CoA ligase family protein